MLARLLTARQRRPLAHEPRVAPRSLSSVASSSAPSLLAELRQRQLVQDVSHAEELAAAIADDHRPFTCYLGIDPTADALHIGHLLPLVVARHLQRSFLGALSVLWDRQTLTI